VNKGRLYQCVTLKLSKKCSIVNSCHYIPEFRLHEKPEAWTGVGWGGDG